MRQSMKLVVRTRLQMKQHLSKSPRKPAQKRSQATVEAIITAATQVMERDGIEALTTNRIAEIAGVGIASLYQYFSDKNHVVHTICQMFINQKLEIIRERLEQSKVTTLENSIREVVRALIEIKSKNSKLERIMETQVPLKGTLKMMDDFDLKLIELCKEFLEPHQKELNMDDLDASLFVVIQALKGVLVIANYSRPEYLKRKDLERILVQMAISGLKA